MAIDSHDLVNSILKSLDRIEHIKPTDLPNIELYMDQVTTFMDERLKNTTRNPGGDKILTKTMINNYTKSHVLPSPEKKKYSKDHVLTLILIYYLKSFLSIKDIQTLLQPVTDKYFGTESTLSFYDLYEELVALGTGQAKALIKDVVSKYNAVLNSFDDAPEEDQAFLQNFAFICMLSFDVYIKKMMIESLIDLNTEDKKGDKKEEKKGDA